ncbi:MAG TPA: sialate O-acetylesterase [Gemmatimonadaceae bacterium]|nr:sialate O-acetylesterase [Gemmatimonadaceae bacterium]
MPRIFSSGMVLQRGQPIALWGWSRPRTDVFVRLASTSTSARADATGAWSLELPSRPAGGPFQLVVRVADDSLVFSDVLIGDVWVASGQSNMEFEVMFAANASETVASANDSTIREFKVPNSWANTPESDLPGGSWLPADRAHVGSFSAVAYFFVRHLRASVNVPIGIINTTWGGSSIETWISRQAQHVTDSAWSAIQQGEAEHDRSVRDSLRAKIGAQLPEVDSGLVGADARWAAPMLDDRSWHEIHVPAYWEGQGYPGLDGIGWYRTSFVLDSSAVRQGVALAVTAIDDDDIAWVNGVEIGRTNGYNVPRHYRIPEGALHVGPNELTIRVADGGGGGGINGATSLMFDDGTRRSLEGAWKFKVGRVVLGTDGQRINKIPSVLYNKMVHPMLPLGIKGVIWYQGESNANNEQQAVAYRAQFLTLVDSWRHAWSGGRNAFPFLWVQLPGYGHPDSIPQLHPAWPLQRESMDSALALPKTGRAIALDLGEADNIHPRDKEDVGARLALVGETVAYGERVDASGPVYRGFTVHADTAIISFSHLAGGLRAHGGSLGGFALAGADKQFVWASARIVGARVYIWSDRVKAPVAVRYAWANNPDRANLFGANGLPAMPFRSDRW